jgi:hypothetical protein
VFDGRVDDCKFARRNERRKFDVHLYGNQQWSQAVFA